jgi:hypothetical protein
VLAFVGRAILAHPGQGVADVAPEVAGDNHAGQGQVGGDQRAVDEGQPGELVQAAEQRNEESDGQEHHQRAGARSGPADRREPDVNQLGTRQL